VSERFRATRVLACLGLLVLGAVIGLSAVWTHSRWWTLVLGSAATLLTEVAAPRGLPRVAYAAGWLVASASFLLARGEGDFVVGSNGVGYAFIGLGLAVLVLAVATIPPRGPGRRGGRTLPDEAGLST
jgi:hypothetical protein